MFTAVQDENKTIMTEFWWEAANRMLNTSEVLGSSGRETQRRENHNKLEKHSCLKKHNRRTINDDDDDDDALA